MKKYEAKNDLKNTKLLISKEHVIDEIDFKNAFFKTLEMELKKMEADERIDSLLRMRGIGSVL